MNYTDRKEKYEIEKAQQTINSLLDNCYKCGEKGHFSKKCPTNIKYTNKVETDVETDVNWDDDFCLSCGGSGIAGDGVQCWFCDEDDNNNITKIDLEENRFRGKYDFSRKYFK